MEKGLLELYQKVSALSDVCWACFLLLHLILYPLPLLRLYMVFNYLTL